MYGKPTPNPTGSRVVLRWSPDPRCVAFARLELRKALADWGLSVLEDSAVLILSELLSNAGLHAKVTPEQTIETRYFRSSGGLRIEVHDGSPESPRARTPQAEAPGGRGLLLVEALADEWGVAERCGPGKVVWASLSVRGAAERNAPEREALERDAPKHDAAERDAAERDAAERDAPESDAPDGGRGRG